MDSIASTTTASSVLDERPLPAPPPRAPVPALCQPGVVLRALLGVLAVVCLGAGIGAGEGGVAPWLAASAAGAAVAVPATLAWLVAACGATPLLAFVRPGLRLLLAGLTGALVAFGAWWPVHAIGLAGGAGAPAVIGTGAALGVAMYHWLDLRARAMLPAATAARLSELQSRIRPHFLFNTLNAAIALVRVDPGRAEEVLEDLSELFRAALAAPVGGESTLGEEIRLARMYVGIERMRFGDRLQVDWEIAPEVAAARVPPLVLQPLVENAVRHGVEPCAEGGRIEVRARVRRGRAWVQVLNTVGGPPQPGHGIGLASVRERLRLMHDLDAQFDAGPTDDGRYRVRLSVPL